MIKILMNCNLLFDMFNALCFSVSVELAVSVSFIHLVCFIKQIAFSCVTDRYLFVCVFIVGIHRKIHTTMIIFIIITNPRVIPNPYDFLSELLFLMKIDGDLLFGAKLWTSLFAFHRGKKIIPIRGWINDVKMWTISVTGSGMSKNNQSFPIRRGIELYLLTLKLWLLFSCRLRCLVKQLDKGEVNVVDLRKNIEYAASVLEAVYIDETR